VKLEQALHFRDELRTARASAARDAENFQCIIVVFEKIGSFLAPDKRGLRQFFSQINQLAARSPLAEKVPQAVPHLHSTFSVKYDLVRKARNAALHEGSLARHLTVHATEISLILEEALMKESHRVGDFMVRNPVCASFWQPLSFIRQTMLVNSFSYLPVPPADSASNAWRFVSDFILAQYLRDTAKDPTNRLLESLQQAVDSKKFQLLPAPTCKLAVDLESALRKSKGIPVLVLAPDNNQLLGILTPFDIL
jgi:hypothetical protein